MSHKKLRGAWVIALGLWISVPAFAAAEPADGPDDGPLRFRFVGPRVGNRIAAVAGVPGDPSTYYAGAASGGIWKSTDGGNAFTPIFDKESAAAIGALAVAPSDPSIVWAGTGEAWMIRDSDVMGNGIYKSTDAGRTWSNMGLPDSGRIGRIVIHPTNADIVYACVLGRATGPQVERGVYRTTDGGHHWERVLFGGDNVGCSGLALDPHNPRTLIAGLWQVEMHTWGEFSGGPGSGVYLSRDGGSKWTRVEEHGLPHPPVGKIDVAIAPTNSNRMFALIQTADQGSLWRSDDAGEHWKVVNYQRALIGRAGYYVRIAVSPASDNEVLVANSSFHQSLDGGENFHETRWGGDTHDIWFDPTNADRFVITDDAGMIITNVHGRGFHRVQLPIGQMYHVAVDNQVPYYFYSNMQDDGNMRGPAVPMDTPGGGWDQHMGGCESGFTMPDTVDPNVVWATCYGNTVTRWDARYKEARSVSPWMHTLDSPPTHLKYRCHWTPPLAIDPFDHNTVYYGCQVVFRTTNAGQSWSVVSPDLSTQDPAHIVGSGGIVGDNLGQFYGEVVFAIAPSKAQKGLIWAGTNDGQVWLTRDGTASWTNVTKNIAGLPPLGTVTSIAPSSTDAGTAYVSVDLHLADNRDPFIFKTADFGKTWKRVSGNLPRHALGYVKVVADDANAPGLLFAGTGNGAYYSIDDGEHWTALATGLPHAPVTWAVVQPGFHDLVVSTYGRGLYILDDISPLEQLAKNRAEPALRVFEPRPAYRFVRAPQAIVNFSLKSAPKGPVKIRILDGEGRTVRELEQKGQAGLNRVRWDLHYESPRVVALRSLAPDNAHIWLEPRFRDADSRPITHWGSKPAEVGPVALAGRYSVRVEVDGLAEAQPLTVLRDPKAPGSDAELAQSVATLLRIRDGISHAADAVNRLEWLRKQLEVVNAMLAPPKAVVSATPAASAADDDDDWPEPPAAPPRVPGSAEREQAEAMRAAVTGFEHRLEAIEARLVSRALRNSDDKYFVEPYGLYLNLIWLNAEVGTGAGDVAGGADFAPTDTQLELLKGYEAESAQVDGELARLIGEDLPALNRVLTAGRLAPVALATP
ncbi:MAG: sialidase [Proteobacteria bacterium]|nr:sialidase [Pseudomonadota bacterium]